RHVAVSNRVCVCVPRFAVLRLEEIPVQREVLTGPRETQQMQPPALVQAPVPPLELHQNEQPAVLLGQLRPSEAETALGPLVVAGVEGVNVYIIERETRDTTGPCLKAGPPEKPLLIIKWPDKCTAKVGEVVTFYLKYTNQGGRPITDIAVSDS